MAGGSASALSLCGALKKKLGLAVASDKVEGRGRVYRITAKR
jgi:hypothetical protein